MDGGGLGSTTMGRNSCLIIPVSGDWPDGLEDMLEEANEEGHGFMERFRREWQDGSERYQRENEGLFVAYQDGRIAGMAAMGLDPFAKNARIGRLRHVFVRLRARRQGLAEALVKACLERGRNFELIRLRTDNAHAARLYERLGFVAVSLDDATHIRRRPTTGAAGEPAS